MRDCGLESLMVDNTFLGLKSKRDRRREEIEERPSLTKVQTKKDRKQYPGFHRAKHGATFLYYHSYHPRVVTLREDPAMLHAQLVLTSELVRNASFSRLHRRYARRRAGCGCDRSGSTSWGSHRCEARRRVAKCQGRVGWAMRRRNKASAAGA